MFGPILSSNLSNIFYLYFRCQRTTNNKQLLIERQKLYIHFSSFCITLPNKLMPFLFTTLILIIFRYCVWYSFFDQIIREMFSIFLNNVWNDVMIWAVKIPKLCHVFLSNWWACDFKSLLIKNILALTLSWFEMVDHWNLMLCTWCKQIYRLNNIPANNKKRQKHPRYKSCIEYKKEEKFFRKKVFNLIKRRVGQSN